MTFFAMPEQRQLSALECALVPTKQWSHQEHLPIDILPTTLSIVRLDYIPEEQACHKNIHLAGVLDVLWQTFLSAYFAIDLGPWGHRR